MAQRAGHDVNYISLSGALHAIGEEGGKPQIPLALVGDFGGGGLMLAYGMVCALLEAKVSGQGQVVDAAIIDGVTTLMSAFFSAQNMGAWKERGTNMLDSGAPFYNTYQCSDGEYIAVGAMEPQFYQQFIEGLGLAAVDLPKQHDKSQWASLKQIFAGVIHTKSRDEWAAIFEDKDACVTPVLNMAEVAQHPHIKARSTLVEINGHPQPAPAPRFSRTEAKVRHPAVPVGEHTDEILEELGLDAVSLREKGAVA